MIFALAFVAAALWLFIRWRRAPKSSQVSAAGVAIAMYGQQARTFFTPYRVPGRRRPRKINGGF